MPGLESLLGAFSQEAFFSEHWEKKPYWLSRGVGDFYEALLPQAELDHVFTAALTLDPATVEVLRADQGRQVSRDPQRPFEAPFLQSAYESGSTLRVNAAHRFSSSLSLLCRALEQSLSLQVSMNLYCSPANAQGAPAHYDRHDVFVLQVSGRKQWKLHPPVMELPLESVPPHRFESHVDTLHFRVNPYQPPVPPVRRARQAFVLEPGDFLYVPRGHIHEVTTEDSHSVHLTVGLRALTYAEYLTSALYQLANQDVRLRRSLPPGFANDRVPSEPLRQELRALGEALRQRLDAGEALTELIQAFMRSRSRLAGVTLGTEDDVPRLATSSWVEHRAGLVLRYGEHDGKATVQFGQKRVALPVEFGPTLQFVLKNRRFQVGDLPGGLSEQSQLTLARRLVREGLLHAITPKNP